jgi:hypothetical protein
MATRVDAMGDYDDARTILPWSRTLVGSAGDDGVDAFNASTRR